MTYGTYTASLRREQPSASLYLYRQRPSAWCADCATEFSDVVAELHRDRTGHRLAIEPQTVQGRAA